MTFVSPTPRYEDTLDHEDIAETAIAAALNSEYVYSNDRGYNSIGFRVVPPTGSTVVFEGSFDGTNYEQISFRSTTSDEYVSSITSTHNIIGSISCLRKFRIRVSVAGSAPGTVMGRANLSQSVLEGLEFANPPHKYGVIPIHKGFEFTTVQTGVAIWTPTSGKKFVITDYAITISGALDATITLFDHTDTSANWILRANIDIGNNTTLPLVSNFYTPIVSSAANNILRLTTTAAITVSGIVHGYEI